MMSRYHEDAANWQITAMDLAAEIGCDEKTARRIIEEVSLFIESVQMLPGGGMAGGSDSYYKQQLRTHIKLKEAVARRAAEIIPPGCSLACSAGTSVALTIRQFVRTQGKYVAIVTNNVGIVSQGLCGVGLHFIGGHYTPSTHSCTGEEVVQALGRVKCMAALVGVSGISAKGSLYAHHNEELAVLQAIIKSATDWVIIVADAFKLAAKDVWEFASIPHVISDVPHRKVIVVTNDPAVLKSKQTQARAEETLSGLQGIKSLSLEAVNGLATH
jgi:DeoR/GlpR family transcriptional regulator of sugar metabolism